jgi:hypothetical protein
MNSSLSLTGKSINNKTCLSGKSNCSSSNLPTDILKIKIIILNNLILPLIAQNWKTLYENLFCLEKVKKQINYYYETYKLDDLMIYKEIITAIEIIINEHHQLEDLERKIYNSKNDFLTMVYKTTLVKLKPEYEIYNIIFGKPLRDLNEKYDEQKIHEICLLLNHDNINFTKIQKILMQKYKGEIKCNEPIY